MCELVVKSDHLNRSECDRLGHAIRSLNDVEREQNRVVLLQGKRNGMCGRSGEGCRVVFLAHRKEQNRDGCIAPENCDLLPVPTAAELEKQFIDSLSLKPAEADAVMARAQAALKETPE